MTANKRTVQRLAKAAGPSRGTGLQDLMREGRRWSVAGDPARPSIPDDRLFGRLFGGVFLFFGRLLFGRGDDRTGAGQFGLAEIRDRVRAGFFVFLVGELFP